MDLVELGGIAGPIDLDLGLQDFNVDTIYMVNSLQRSVAAPGPAQHLCDSVKHFSL